MCADEVPAKTEQLEEEIRQLREITQQQAQQIQAYQAMEGQRQGEHRIGRWQPTKTSETTDEECPICGESINGEHWQCPTCKHHICNECAEHWFGSELEYALPADEAGPVFMLQAGRHNTNCPYCRAEFGGDDDEFGGVDLDEFGDDSFTSDIFKDS
jgi:rubrerythrin